MNTSLAFADVAADPLRSARAQLEETLSGCTPDEAYLKLRLDFEDLLREDHGLDDNGCVAIFGPLEALGSDSIRMEQLLHMCSSYIVAREIGLIPTHSAA